ncbi:hypothetical protein Csa_019647 [Cucumis sativus]|nr:hypothetical protein Csa_019647 [Cucumis sativus]
MEKTREVAKHGRLLLVPCPYQGHINPMLNLATYLHRNGFSITIAHTSFNSPNPNRHPEFTFICLNDCLADDLVASLDIAILLLTVNNNCKASLEEAMATVLRDVVCVIHDEIMTFCAEVASSFGVRSLVLRTNSVSTCIGRSVVLQLHAEGRLPLLDQGFMEDEVPNLHPLRYKDLPISAFSDISQSTKLVHKMHDLTTSSGVIWNTIPFLEPSEFTKFKANICNQIPIFAIGPIHKISPTSSSSSLLNEDYTCLPWLHKQPPNSVIYVSLGSVALLTNHELQEMAWGWLIAINHSCVSFALAPFEARMGSDLFWKSFKRRLEIEGDQRGNARYISCVWRVGLTLEGHELKRNEVEKGIRKLMVEEEGRKMRERAMDFKRRIEDCLREGGSCSRNLRELVDFIMSS